MATSRSTTIPSRDVDEQIRAVRSQPGVAVRACEASGTNEDSPSRRVDPEKPVAPSDTPPNQDSNNSNSSRCCNMCCCWLDGNSEAIAFLLDTIATSLVFAGSGAFLVTALMKLATIAAGCDLLAANTSCQTKVHGFKPSSLLTSYATAIGLTAAVCLPVCGAWVDTTRYRRGLGRILALLFTLAVLPGIFLNQDNWYPVSIAYAIMAGVGLFETMTLYAYLPELTREEWKLNKYTRTFAVVSYAGMVIFLALVVGLSAVVNAFKGDDAQSLLDKDLTSAHLSQGIAFSLSAILFGIAWGFLFQPRSPARVLAPNQSVWTNFFTNLYQTLVRVHRYHPKLQWFFVAIAFGDAGTSALFFLSITYMTEVLHFSGADNGTCIVILLLAGIPGGFLSSYWTRRFNPVSSSLVALAILIINTTLVAIFLTRPGQQVGAYIAAIGWGIGTGWKWTVDRLLYARLLPTQDQNTEYSGVYVFCRQSINWLPPLLFTAINEANVSLRWGMVSLDIFFGISFLIYVVGVGVRGYTVNNNENNNLRERQEGEGNRHALQQGEPPEKIQTETLPLPGQETPELIAVEP